MKSQSHRYLLVTLFIALLFVLWAQIPALRDPFQIEEDVRNLPWMWSLTDSTLFSRSPFIQGKIFLISLGNMQWPYIIDNPVYGLLIQLGSYFVSPLTLVKLIPIPLTLLVAYYAFRLGQTAVTNRFAVIFSLTFVALNLTLHTEVSVIAGLQRSFVSLFVLVLAYYLLSGHFGRAALTLFFAATIYVPILPVCGLTYLFSCIDWRNQNNLSWQRRINWRAISWLFFICVVILIFMFPLFQEQLMPSNPAPQTPISESSTTSTAQTHPWENPRFSLKGPKPLFIFFPFIGRGGIASGPSVGILIGLFAFFLIASYPLLKKQFQKPPVVLQQILYASIIVYILSWLIFFITSRFLLYIPSRHTQTTLFIVLLFMTLQNAVPAFKAWVDWISRHRQKAALFIFILTLLGLVVIIWQIFRQGLTFPSAIVAGLLLLLAVISWQLFKERTATSKTETPTFDLPRWGQILLLFFILLLAFSYIRFASPPFHNPTPDEREMYEYLQSLPKDALISGHPCSLDGVPIFAQRNILFNCEEYGYADPQSVSATLVAYYNDNPEQILAYCHEYGVDYLIVDTEKWLTHDRIVAGNFFYEPYASALQPDLIAQSQFALASINPEQYLFTAGSLFIIPCTEIAFD
ncbi:MAG: hypothetical protein IAF02_20665 [Anaerolineae bacterium]|nr:hypothetical protein [Anaerolineae bacterium]